MYRKSALVITIFGYINSSIFYCFILNRKKMLFYFVKNNIFWDWQRNHVFMADLLITTLYLYELNKNFSSKLQYHLRKLYQKCLVFLKEFWYYNFKN